MSKNEFYEALEKNDKEKLKKMILPEKLCYVLG